MQTNTDSIFERLDALRTELADLAFTLECEGRLDAADVANTISARVREIREELLAGGKESAAANFSNLAEFLA